MKMKLALGSSLAALGLATALTFSPALACDGDKDAKTAKAADKPAPVKPVVAANVMAVDMKVDGMMCESCGDKIKSALAKIDGIMTVDVKQADGLVSVKYDKTKTSPGKIAKAISALGFKASAEA
jgi:copper chaperone CopZ